MRIFYILLIYFLYFFPPLFAGRPILPDDEHQGRREFFELVAQTNQVWFHLHECSVVHDHEELLLRTQELRKRMRVIHTYLGDDKKFAFQCKYAKKHLRRLARQIKKQKREMMEEPNEI